MTNPLALDSMVAVTRSYRYRLAPSRVQAATLMAWLRLTRELYNAALQERKEAWDKQRISVTRYDQQAQLPAIRADCADFAAVPAIALRGAIHRLDKAFVAFFRRVKSGERPGYPRFKSARRWNCIEFDNPVVGDPIVAGGKRVKVPLLGKVKLCYHRPLEGRPRTMKIKLDGDGNWYISIACDGVQAKPLPATGASVGVDLGLLTFAATSDGEMFENPRPLRVARIRMERAQRRVSRRKKGSKRRRRAVRLLGRQYAHVANIRREQHIVVARSLVARYDTIYVEDLNIKGLAAGMFAKSVNDAAWGRFQHWLDCKAEEAGRRVVEVDPRGTSQTCSRCGCVGEHKSLAVRVHRCADCGLEIDRDVNAAVNVKSLGMSEQGGARAVGRPRRSAKCAKANHRAGHASRIGVSSA